jgi:outer membrane immunogenic protein
MKNTSLRVVVVSASLIWNSAIADELPVIAVQGNQASQVKTSSWAGCRIGGNIGWLGGNANQNLEMAGGYLEPGNLFSDPGNSAKLNHSYKTSTSGVVGGIGAGCDYQAESFFWGFEADLNGSNLSETTQASYRRAGPMDPTTVYAAPHTEKTNFELPWFITLRGRLGKTVDRFLIYATGGLAYGQIKSSTAVNFDTTPVVPHFLSGLSHQGSSSENRLGWTVGAGVEWSANRNWSIKAEYLYVDFGKFSYSSPCVNCPAGLGPDSWKTTGEATQNIFRTAVYYHFDN